MEERAELEDEELLLRKAHFLSDGLRDVGHAPGPPGGLGITPFDGLDDHRDGIEVRPVEQPVSLLQVRDEKRIRVTEPGAQLLHDPKCQQGSLVEEGVEVLAGYFQDRCGLEGPRGGGTGSFVQEGHFSEKVAVALDGEDEVLSALELLRDLDLPSVDDEELVRGGKLLDDHRPCAVVFQDDDLGDLAEIGFRYFREKRDFLEFLQGRFRGVRPSSHSIGSNHPDRKDTGDSWIFLLEFLLFLTQKVEAET